MVFVKCVHSILIKYYEQGKRIWIWFYIQKNNLLFNIQHMSWIKDLFNQTSHVHHKENANSIIRDAFNTNP